MSLSIVYLYRKPNPRYFSIEKVFQNVRSVLKKEFDIVEWYAPSGRAKPADILKNGLAAKKLDGDIYHITGDVHYLAFFLDSKKTILTIHDCIFLKEPNPVKRKILKWLFLDGPVKNAKLITTISETSRQDII